MPGQETPSQTSADLRRKGVTLKGLGDDLQKLAEEMDAAGITGIKVRGSINVTDQIEGGVLGQFVETAKTRVRKLRKRIERENRRKKS